MLYGNVSSAAPSAVSTKRAHKTEGPQIRPFPLIRYVAGNCRVFEHPFVLCAQVDVLLYPTPPSRGGRYDRCRGLSSIGPPPSPARDLNFMCAALRVPTEVRKARLFTNRRGAALWLCLRACPILPDTAKYV